MHRVQAAAVMHRCSYIQRCAGSVRALLDSFDVQQYVAAEVGDGIVDSEDNTAAPPERLERAFRMAADALRLPGAEVLSCQLLEVTRSPLTWRRPAYPVTFVTGLVLSLIVSTSWHCGGCFVTDASCHWSCLCALATVIFELVALTPLCLCLCVWGNWQAIVCAAPSQHFAACAAIVLATPAGCEDARKQALDMLAKLPFEVEHPAGDNGCCGSLFTCFASITLAANLAAPHTHPSRAQILSANVVADVLRSMLAALQAGVLSPPYLPYDLIRALLQVGSPRGRPGFSPLYHCGLDPVVPPVSGGPFDM